MNYEELVKSKRCIGNMDREELLTYCYGLLEEVWDFEKRIDKALRKLKASEKHFKTQRENNVITFTIRILEGSDKE